MTHPSPVLVSAGVETREHDADRSTAASTDEQRSDWPASLLLDETWLRVRRTLVHRLECSGNWTSTASQTAFMQTMKAQGESLKSRLLKSAIGDLDYAHLGSEGIFGAANQRVRRKIPYVLSFGYEWGAFFSSIHNTEEPRIRYDAETCALFNLGISLFDLVLDTLPDLHAEFRSGFDERLLCQLADAADESTVLRRASEDLRFPEIRVLAKIIAEFFARLHAEPQAVGGGLDGPLPKLLLEAYRAEEHSVGALSALPRHVIEVCRAKSTLPFTIMHEVARRGSPARGQGVPQGVETLVRDIGETFWLTDDLVDLVLDAQSDSPNSILAAAAERCPSGSTSLTYALLANVLEGNHIEDTAERIVACVASVVEELQTLELPHEARARAPCVLRSYVRQWME